MSSGHIPTTAAEAKEHGTVNPGQAKFCSRIDVRHPDWQLFSTRGSRSNSHLGFKHCMRKMISEGPTP